jgi:hypothetical protein
MFMIAFLSDFAMGKAHGQVDKATFPKMKMNLVSTSS